MILAKAHIPGFNDAGHDFAGLMEVYEQNYIRLRRLVPDLSAIGPVAVSRVDGALDLHLRIVERCKYTTTLTLTYQFQDELGRFPAPDLQARIYHDAQAAEVIACGRLKGVRSAEYDRRHKQYSLAEKWQINRFLQKWLGYCLRQGHGFPPQNGRVTCATDTERTGVSTVER
ncbi:MAG: DUF1249 domain-containing protein [Gammaproteobacteria bacterium]